MHDNTNAVQFISHSYYFQLILMNVHFTYFFLKFRISVGISAQFHYHVINSKKLSCSHQSKMFVLHQFRRTSHKTNFSNFVNVVVQFTNAPIENEKVLSLQTCQLIRKQKSPKIYQHVSAHHQITLKVTIHD